MYQPKDVHARQKEISEYMDSLIQEAALKNRHIKDVSVLMQEWMSKNIHKTKKISGFSEKLHINPVGRDWSNVMQQITEVVKEKSLPAAMLKLEAAMRIAESSREQYKGPVPRVDVIRRNMTGSNMAVPMVYAWARQLQQRARAEFQYQIKKTRRQNQDVFLAKVKAGERCATWAKTYHEQGKAMVAPDII
jgi:hypothetical protein